MYAKGEALFGVSLCTGFESCRKKSWGTALKSTRKQSRAKHHTHKMKIQTEDGGCINWDFDCIS